MFWKQRYKVHWLRGGDQNTRFFHAMTFSKKKRNTIHSLIDVHCNVTNEHVDLCGVSCAYCDDLFSAQRTDPTIITSFISLCVHANDNSILLVPFVIQEFRVAFMSMDSYSVLGPNGINPTFYKRFWDLVGNQVFIACCSWLYSSVFPPNINETTIALIPKCDSPFSMKDWRPISFVMLFTIFFLRSWLIA